MPTPRQEAIARCTVLLGSVKKNAQDVKSVPETRVREYHAILDKIKTECGIDIAGFRIPPDDLAPVMTSFDTFKKEKKFTREKFASKELFLARVNAAIKALDLGKVKP